MWCLRCGAFDVVSLMWCLRCGVFNDTHGSGVVQVANGVARIEAAMPRVLMLAQGGTAVGTGAIAPCCLPSVFCGNGVRDLLLAQGGTTVGTGAMAPCTLPSVFCDNDVRDLLLRVSDKKKFVV